MSMSSNPSQQKLFGIDSWEVKNAADPLTEASEMERSSPKLYAAALKLVARRQTAMGAVLRAAASKRKS